MDDPWGDHLADLVVYLKDADDSDLVLVDFCALSQHHYKEQLAMEAIPHGHSIPMVHAQTRVYV